MPFRSDGNGKLVLTGPYAEYRQLYVLHEARGWVGYHWLERTPADGGVEIRLEPACHVYGQLMSTGLGSDNLYRVFRITYIALRLADSA